MLNSDRFDKPVTMAPIQPAKKFTFDVGWVLISSALIVLFGFIVKPLLARWLGPGGLGLYSLSLTIYGIAVLIANLGISQAILKYAAEEQNTGIKARQLVFSSFTTSFVIGVLATVLMCIFRNYIASFFHMPEFSRLIPVLSLAMPFASLFQSTQGLFNGLRQMKTFAILAFGESALRTLFVVVMVNLLGIEGAIMGLVFAEVGISLLGLLLAKKFIRFSVQHYISNARRLVSFGGQMFAANATNTILNQADIIMIGYFLTASDVGYYSAALVIFTFFGMVPSAIQMVTFPAASSYWSDNNRTALNSMINKSMKYTACILIPLGLGIGFFAKEILSLIFGAGFVVAALPLIIILIVRVIRNITVVPIGNVLPGIGRPDINLKIELISAIMSVGLNVLLVPRWGIVGAAIATSISLLVGGIIFLVFVIRLTQVKIDARWHVYAFGMAGLASLLFWGLTNFVSPYLSGGAILILCIFIILRFLLTKEDRHMFLSLANSLIPRR